MESIILSVVTLKCGILLKHHSYYLHAGFNNILWVNTYSHCRNSSLIKAQESAIYLIDKVWFYLGLAVTLAEH